jgi:hypothetical protein
VHSTGKLPISAKSQIIHQQAFPVVTQEDNPYSGAVDWSTALARADHPSNASLNNEAQQHLMMLLSKQQTGGQSRQAMIGDYISAQAFYTQNYLHNPSDNNVLQSFIQGPPDMEDATGLSPPHIQTTQQDEESESLLNSHRRSRS